MFINTRRVRRPMHKYIMKSNLRVFCHIPEVSSEIDASAKYYRSTTTHLGRQRPSAEFDWQANTTPSLIYIAVSKKQSDLLALSHLKVYSIAAKNRTRAPFAQSFPFIMAC